jgi:hypothetical protein
VREKKRNGLKMGEGEIEGEGGGRYLERKK